MTRHPIPEFVREEWYRLRAAHTRLGPYTLRINPRLTAILGRCRYGQKLVELAAWLVAEQPEEQVLDTLRHEVAHVLAGGAAGHGPTWKRWARDLGTAPTRCAQGIKHSETPAGRRPPKYTLECPEHGVVGSYRRKTRAVRRVAAFGDCSMVTCRLCGSSVTLRTHI